MAMNAQPPLFPIILPDRQERFCVLYVQGLTATDAYLKAYDGKNYGGAAANASRMLKRDKVIQRIEQLRRDAHAAERVTLPFLTAGLRRAIGLAESLGQPSAAVAGWMGIAKLHGLIVDRVAADLVVRRPSASPESPDEMDEGSWLARHGLLSIDQEEPKSLQVIEHNQDEQDSIGQVLPK